MARSEQAVEDRDRGFGLIEVVIAMALLMIASLAMLPVVISALYLSKDNVSLTTATQFVAEQLDGVRGIPSTCDALHEFVDNNVGRQIADPQGVTLEISFDTETACPLSYPAAYRLSATVIDQESGRVIAEAWTRVIVTSKCECPA